MNGPAVRSRVSSAGSSARSHSGQPTSVPIRASRAPASVTQGRKLSGGLLMDLLRAHPLTVMNGVVHENPFYTPAEEMLRELHQRRTLS